MANKKSDYRNAGYGMIGGTIAFLAWSFIDMPLPSEITFGVAIFASGLVSEFVGTIPGIEWVPWVQHWIFNVMVGFITALLLFSLFEVVLGIYRVILTFTLPHRLY